jgi:hypothetical protein
MVSCILVGGAESKVRHRYLIFCTKDGGTLGRPGNDSRRVVGVSGAVRGTLTIAGTRGLLPAGVKDSSVTTHRLKISRVSKTVL